MPNNKRNQSPVKICIITASRSEYGLMRWLMNDLKSAKDFQLQIVVTGSHLSEEHGMTYREIEQDGFSIDALIPLYLDNADKVLLSQATADLNVNLARVFVDLMPDLVMVMGDRYELLSVLTTCVLSGIPLAHISGGEITEGAIDDQIRHAMTKISHLHYVANEVYASRVKQMGEEDWRICISGEPGLDNLYRQPMHSLLELEVDLGLDFSKPTAIVTYHPVTLHIDDLDKQLKELCNALESAANKHHLQYVITYPNADLGFDRIIAVWNKFVDGRDDRIVVKSLGQSRYLGALSSLTMMIGNSSSGLVEAPSFNMPVVNIGERQKGRMRGKNVIDVECSHIEILSGIESALVWDSSVSCFNPYGDGKSSERVLGHLRKIFTQYNSKQLLNKKFTDTSQTLESEKDFNSKHGLEL
jgi:GDP/UDP-N,N'-diacetylbacillosamine 2-epimerase (hydrolysing)